MGYHKSFAENKRAEFWLGGAVLGSSIFSGTNNIVKTASAVYMIYVNDVSDVVYVKSTDGGRVYGSPVTVRTGTVTSLAVWYDGWSGLATGHIHMAMTDSGTDDTHYRTIDTANSDALSTATVIFAGATTAASGHLTITRTRGGNVLCKTSIDGNTEGGFYRLPNANVPDGAWDAALTINEALAVDDKMIMLPGFAADNQDAIGIFWDADASEISRQLYDDSANTWAETSIAASMTHLAESSGGPNFSAAVDLTNSRIVLVAWSNTDTLNADLRCWTVTESTITEVTNVVENSTDDQALCAIAIDTANDDWYVIYAGKSDGSETWSSAVRPYYKVSTDNGTTWSTESVLPYGTPARTIVGMTGCPNFTGQMPTFILVSVGGAGSILTIIERNP